MTAKLLPSRRESQSSMPPNKTWPGLVWQTARKYHQQRIAMALYDGKIFRPASNTPNGEVGDDTRFHYHQSGSTVWAEYAGSQVAKGHLIALVGGDGALDMRYHHVNTKGELMTGRCRSVPVTLPDGRLQLHETWQWTSGDGSSGTSVLEEVKE